MQESRRIWYKRNFHTTASQVGTIATAISWRYQLSLKNNVHRNMVFDPISNVIKIYIGLILRAAVIADYKIMDILNIIIRAWAARHAPIMMFKPFCCFTYVIDTSPTSQLILQPFRRFMYATAHSTTLPPRHLRHRSFYNPSVASRTAQALDVLHLASRPCIGE